MGACRERRFAPRIGDNFGNNRLGGESHQADPSIGYRSFGAPEKTQRALTNPHLSNVADTSSGRNLVIASGRGELEVTTEE
jgi:hypothetical protein